jgi:hypothetical protein
MTGSALALFARVRQRCELTHLDHGSTPRLPEPFTVKQYIFRLSQIINSDFGLDGQNFTVGNVCCRRFGKMTPAFRQKSDENQTRLREADFILKGYAVMNSGVIDCDGYTNRSEMCSGARVSNSESYDQ